MTHKTCTKCKERKPLSEFHNDIAGVLGKRASCAECESERQRIRREKRTAQAKALVDAWKPVKRPDVVPPRTFNHLKDLKAVWTGHTERQYIRNEGLKHIPSRGMPT